MRGCPECKAKLWFGEILKSAFIIEILLMVIATSVIGFKKRYE